jgi:hypothetical protein
MDARPAACYTSDVRLPARQVDIAAFALLVLATLVTTAPAAETPVALSDALGDEISRAERDAYRLFPDVAGFVSARIVKLDKGYRVDFTFEDKNGAVHHNSRKIDEEAFQNTRRHVALVEMSQNERTGDASLDSRVLYVAALRFAADGRYDLANSILDELRRDYPARYDSLHAERAHGQVSSLLDAKTGLFRSGSAFDQSGRTDVLVFAGYYGVWLAIGMPLAFDVDSSEGFATFLVTVPAASIFIAHNATKNRSVTEADAEMVSLGGWYGTWQGVGWSAFGDADDQTIFGAGVASGLAGIGIACLVNSQTELSEGHASLMNSANWWGAWFGMLLGAGMSDDSDDVLAKALVGSTLAVGATAAAGSGTPLNERRVRFMNLGGILGAIFGGGVVLLADTDSNGAIAATFAATSVVGGYLGVHLSRPDEREQSRIRMSPDEMLAVKPAPRVAPFAGWSQTRSETRVGFEVRF